jgi:hypothetical protein
LFNFKHDEHVSCCAVRAESQSSATRWQSSLANAPNSAICYSSKSQLKNKQQYAKTKILKF